MKIIGLKKFKAKVIKNKKGDILKFLSKKDVFFKGFGEVYFSEIKKNKVKGWNCHKRNVCILGVPSGNVEFFFIDGRHKSKSYFAEEKILVNKKNYKILKVPPGIWFSFRSLSKLSVVSNCINNPHLDGETEKKKKFKKYKIN